jgi:hypothetical protein
MLIMYNILFMHNLNKLFGSVEFVLVVGTHGRGMHAFDIKWYCIPPSQARGGKLANCNMDSI